MRKLTDNLIDSGVLEEFVPINTAERQRLVNKLNETYQYHSKSFRDINKGDYTILKVITQEHIIKMR